MMHCSSRMSWVNFRFAMHCAQRSLDLQDWPTRDAKGQYCVSAAHEIEFVQQSRQGRILVAVWTLEIFDKLFIQACKVQVGAFDIFRPLRDTKRGRFSNPDQAQQAGLQQAQKLLKQAQKACPEADVASAQKWVLEQLGRCRYRLEQQHSLFP